jgi:hypothetical protein
MPLLTRDWLNSAIPHFHSSIIIPEHSHWILVNPGPLKPQSTSRIGERDAAVTFEQT